MTNEQQKNLKVGDIIRWEAQGDSFSLDIVVRVAKLFVETKVLDTNYWGCSIGREERIERGSLTSKDWTLIAN